MKTKIKLMALVAGLLATADDFRFAAGGER